MILGMQSSDPTLEWRHNERDGVSHHQPHDCLRKRLFRRRSKKTSKLRVSGLCVGNSPVTGELSAQMAINTENVSILMTSSGPQKKTLVFDIKAQEELPKICWLDFQMHFLKKNMWISLIVNTKGQNKTIQSWFSSWNDTQ